MIAFLSSIPAEKRGNFSHTYDDTGEENKDSTSGTYRISKTIPRSFFVKRRFQSAPSHVHHQQKETENECSKDPMIATAITIERPHRLPIVPPLNLFSSGRSRSGALNEEKIDLLRKYDNNSGTPPISSNGRCSLVDSDRLPPRNLLLVSPSFGHSSADFSREDHKKTSVSRNNCQKSNGSGRQRVIHSRSTGDCSLQLRPTPPSEEDSSSYHHHRLFNDEDFGDEYADEEENDNFLTSSRSVSASEFSPRPIFPTVLPPRFGSRKTAVFSPDSTASSISFRNRFCDQRSRWYKTNNDSQRRQHRYRPTKGPSILNHRSLMNRSQSGGSDLSTQISSSVNQSKLSLDMLPLSHSFSGKLDSSKSNNDVDGQEYRLREESPAQTPDSPWERFPSMVHNPSNTHHGHSSTTTTPTSVPVSRTSSNSLSRTSFRDATFHAIIGGRPRNYHPTNARRSVSQNFVPSGGGAVSGGDTPSPSPSPTNLRPPSTLETEMRRVGLGGGGSGRLLSARLSAPSSSNRSTTLSPFSSVSNSARTYASNKLNIVHHSTPHSRSSSARIGGGRLPSTTGSSLKSNSSYLLTPPPSESDHFVRSVSCEIGDITNRIRDRQSNPAHHGQTSNRSNNNNNNSDAFLVLTQLMKFKKEFRIQRRHSHRHRRSFHAGASPIMAPRCRSPSSLATAAAQHPSTSSSGSHPSEGGSQSRLMQQTSTPSTSGVGGVHLRQSASGGAAGGGSMTQGGIPMRSAVLSIPDTRRWSLASLPSSSGYGTPGSSAFSSQYSSQERLAMAMEDLTMIRSSANNNNNNNNSGQMASTSTSTVNDNSSRQQMFGSNESHPSLTDETELNRSGSSQNDNVSKATANTSGVAMRPRSRSLSSPTKLMYESSSEALLKNNVYKERFPKAKQQMEERLEKFISQHDDAIGGSNNSRSSTNLSAPSSEDVSGEIVNVLRDGSGRFLLHQILETAGDCLNKSRDDLITSTYFLELNQNLNDLICEAKEKSPVSVNYLSNLVRELLMIVSRPARLLECLEFDPEDFYHWLEVAEGQVRSQMPTGAQIPELPHYIIEKLGLASGNVGLEDEAGEGGSDAPLVTPGSRLSWTESMLSSTDSGMSGHPHHQLMSSISVVEQPAEQCRQEANRHALFAGRPPGEGDFETVKLISNGAYGAVWLVRHRETRERFALKKLSKRNMMLRNTVDQVYAERDILTFTDNPFVVSFYGSFETKSHLCMVMEYVEGGDCASLIKAIGQLPVETAKPYIAETVLAIEYLHSYGIVHRDIKPDNLLITAMGHVKLTDFGLSKIGLMNRTTLYAEGMFLDPYSETHQFKDNQLCGTPEYIAPEVILRQGYGKPVDWWALGIITYEFLLGCLPFMGDSPDELFQNIIQEEVVWPGEEDDFELEEVVINLVNCLLAKNPLERLGTCMGAEEVKSHPFFDDLDYRTILKQKAEFIPQLDNEEDTSYFDTRADRYNHDMESDGDDGHSHQQQQQQALDDSGSSSNSMFWSFSSASPRHSFTGELPPQSSSSAKPDNHPARAQSFQEHSHHQPSSSNLHHQPPVVIMRKGSQQSQSSLEDGGVDSAYSVSEAGSVDSRSRASSDVQGMVRQRVVSSGASSTTSGGTPSGSIEQHDSAATTPSAAHVPTSGGSAASNRTIAFPPTTETTPTGGDVVRRRTQTVPLPRFAISCETNDGTEVTKELSPVEEKLTTTTTVRSTPSPASKSVSTTASTPSTMTTTPSKSTSTISLHRQHSHHGHGSHRTSGGGGGGPPPSIRSRTSSLRKSGGGSGGGHHLVGKSTSLHLVIPSSPPPPNNNQSAVQIPMVVSPSASSTSSRDDSPSRTGIDISPAILQLKPPIVLRKGGAKGFGFIVRSVRVYLGEQSEYFTIQHIVSHVDVNSPAFEAGLRSDELITHVHGEPVQNLTNPQLMQRLFSFGETLTLRTVPLDQTSIRTGAARKAAGKMARKKGYKQKLQRRVLESKKRKANLLRRLSGKRTSGELRSLPRSVSNSEGIVVLSPHQQQQQSPSGVGISPSSATTSTTSNSATPTTASAAGGQQNRRSDVNIAAGVGGGGGSGSPSSGSGSASSSPASSNPHSPAFPLYQGRPSTLVGLKQKLAHSLKSPGRRKSAATMPLSPLARVEQQQQQQQQQQLHSVTSVCATTTSAAQQLQEQKSGGSGSGGHHYHHLFKDQQHHHHPHSPSTSASSSTTSVPSQVSSSSTHRHPQHHQGGGPTGSSHSPTRSPSPSPLAAGSTTTTTSSASSTLPSTAAGGCGKPGSVMSVVKKTITKPRKSTDSGSSTAGGGGGGSSELLRMALRPQANIGGLRSDADQASPPTSAKFSRKNPSSSGNNN